ncbi:MAG TPA: hypothetical protein VIN61_09385 [Gammaproteobacteria bacterium]
MLWAASLALPAVQIASSGQTYAGLDLLLGGFRAARAHVYAWYANPLFVVAALLGAAGMARAAGVLSAVALLLGLSSFFAADTARAAGMAVPQLDWRVGFYVWLAALAALCTWSWAYVACDRRRRRDEN